MPFAAKGKTHDPLTAEHVPGLFARNERRVCVFADPANVQARPWVLVLVGATIIGSISTVWHGTVNAKRSGRRVEWSFADQAIVLP